MSTKTDLCLQEFLAFEDNEWYILDDIDLEDTISISYSINENNTSDLLADRVSYLASCVESLLSRVQNLEQHIELSPSSSHNLEYILKSKLNIIKNSSSCASTPSSSSSSCSNSFKNIKNGHKKRKMNDAFSHELAARVKEPELKRVSHILKEKEKKFIDPHAPYVKKLEEDMINTKLKLRRISSCTSSSNSSSSNVRTIIICD